MMINCNETPEFKKDFKKLFRKYRTLFDDLENFKKRFVEIDIKANKNFAILTENNNFRIIKARLFCRALKGNSLRVIYAQFRNCEKVEFISIDFIELYFKGDKTNEDRERIKDYLNKN
ncbi:MAG: hypothetical protein US42_C0001G0003 [Candidatus Magasanikbacteria bacterium GW2011_GWC2_37_14]|uniref:Uncharacterized protein n=1 Tax=Candidatus Magasanikbacteria bacterium GW2011_GWC2_37_14 TaxID=1619046 RepID=A0A0G0GDV4_9BACT|nr:MAG: hypothetical protein US42_C0001G0003 [Candidatus Magasanikbacteria bacterium GW2011_GWC2_37_14]